jgi:hypothetical protein
MFGEFILMTGVAVIGAGVSKTLESIGKEKQAKLLDTGMNAGFAIYVLKQVNDMFKEINEFL